MKISMTATQIGWRRVELFGHYTSFLQMLDKFTCVTSAARDVGPANCSN